MKTEKRDSSYNKVDGAKALQDKTAKQLGADKYVDITDKFKPIAKSMDLNIVQGKLFEIKK